MLIKFFSVRLSDYNFSARDLMVRFQTGKKNTRVKKRKQKMMSRITKRSNKALVRETINFSAIDLLHDPQVLLIKILTYLNY